MPSQITICIIIIMKRSCACIEVDDPYEANTDPVFSDDSMSSYSNDPNIDESRYTDDSQRLKTILSFYRHLLRTPEHAPIKPSKHEREIILSLLKGEMP